MLDAPDLCRHLADIDIRDLGLGTDLLCCRGRNDAQLGLRFGQCRLEVKPLLDAGLFREDVAQFVGAPKMLERLHVEDGNGHGAGS
ncbi:hypothetical protein G6F68_011361 [Rhizopus microsporus]|uniref:Uncharacterized protein n=1 Tax=Rhizopus delemar TaxID=936053 RepID=A0A9P6Y3R5_9FUNG|nr:hypothetical protein G6F68_011361 [Rhizopus microsporus]KAG1538742.1 hypothetical protein G6F50_014621 [Rhizopus delemar]